MYNEYANQCGEWKVKREHGKMQRIQVVKSGWRTGMQVMIEKEKRHDRKQIDSEENERTENTTE